MLEVSELLDWLKADEADYDTVDSLRAAAITHVENETGMAFGTAGEVVQGLGTTWPMALRGVPDPEEDFLLERWSGTAWETVDATTYYLDGAFVRLAGTTYPLEAYRYRATYTTGYLDGEQPEPIKLAVRVLVQMWFDGNESDDTWRAVRNLLAPYRRAVV